MNSIFLCVIGVGLLFQVFARDRFHSKLWHMKIKKMNEEIKKRRATELADSIAKRKAYELADLIAVSDHHDPWTLNETPFPEIFDSMKTQIWPPSLSGGYQPKTDFVQNNAFVDEDQQPLIRSKRTKAYLFCAQKTGMNPDTILSIKAGVWLDGDQDAKNWVQCVLMENNLMTDESVFRLDVAFKNLTYWERRSLEENIDKCLPMKPMPPVEISWEFAKCFQSADRENSLF